MFRLVSAPTIFPACSLLRNTVGPMVDTEVILQTGGRVYLTETEGWEVVNTFPTFPAQLGLRATQLGWLSPVEATARDARIAELEEQVAGLEALAPRVVSLEDARKLIDAGSRLIGAPGTIGRAS